MLEEVARVGVRLLMQTAIEAEVTELLGRERYSHGQRIRQGSRNGLTNDDQDDGRAGDDRPAEAAWHRRGVRLAAARRRRVPHKRLGVTRDRRVRAGPVGPLIRPPGNEYEPMNIHIHGITPSFPHAGAHERSALLHGGVAGGAVTPLRPARRCAQCTLRPRRHPGLPLGGGRSTRRAAFPMRLRARAWPGWPSYRLNAVAQACGFSFKHHRAGEDAAATAQVGEPSAGPPDNLPSSGQLARSESTSPSLHEKAAGGTGRRKGTVRPVDSRPLRATRPPRRCGDGSLVSVKGTGLPTRSSRVHRAVAHVRGHTGRLAQSA